MSVYLDAKAFKDAVERVLAHVSHARITKNCELCCSLYFWPGMYNDWKQLVARSWSRSRSAGSWGDMRLMMMMMTMKMRMLLPTLLVTCLEYVEFLARFHLCSPSFLGLLTWMPCVKFFSGSKSCPGVRKIYIFLVASQLGVHKTCPQRRQAALDVHSNR